jgi:uncharacterized protein YerC
MPQVSRRRLPKQVEERIYESFYKAITLLGKEGADLFYNDLLTKTEKVMIPKRLAIAILLSKGRTYAEIKDRLNVTQSTIVSVAKTLEYSEGYKLAIKKLEKSEAWREMWQDIERTLYRFNSPGRAFIDEEVIKHKLGHKKKTLV